jgi:hypothetical protein
LYNAYFSLGFEPSMIENYTKFYLMI